MKQNKLAKWLAASLAAAMLVQTAVPQTAVYAQEAAVQAEESDGTDTEVQEREADPSEAQTGEGTQQETAVPQLQNGTAVIPAGSDAAAVKEILGHALVANADEVDLQSLEWEYYCEGKDTSTGWTTNEAWGSVNGFTSEKKIVFVTTTYTHPALADNSDGSYQVRLAGADTEVTLTKAAKNSSSIVLNDGCSVNLAYNEDLSIDYDRMRENIFSAAVVSSEPQLTVNDVTIEYYATAVTGAVGSLGKAWVPLEGGTVNALKYPAMSEGTWRIRISYGENEQYYGTSAETEVTVADGRYASTIVYKDGASITYNMDPAVMKQAILDSAIDWENSVLPGRDAVETDDFTMEYYGTASSGSLGEVGKNWVPIEGGTAALLDYPAMGAGEQQIRISYKGNTEYKPISDVKGTLSVNKAKVSVKVSSTNIFADEALPEGFVTTDPADDFDVYTLFVGATSDISSAVYLNLPERYTDNAFLKLLDPIVEAVSGKSFTQMLNDGVTVGELRELFSTQELLELLDKLNIDTGVFGQILEVINGLPSLVDSVRIAFGTPNRAGLYTAAAITDNVNYETGVGIGMVLVKMRASGVKLTWNQEIPGGKLTAEQAETFDFGAMVSYNGDVTISQSNVHYLYSGFTSSWKIYSSTTTPPTEPGSYIVTVVTLGGNYLAAPITRTFTITE